MSNNKTMVGILQHITYAPRAIVLGCIVLYQKTLSLDHGLAKILFPNGYCKFYPSCSQYGYCAIKKYGILKGTKKTLYRILRCNPWNEGGIDVP